MKNKLKLCERNLNNKYGQTNAFISIKHQTKIIIV